MQHSRRGWELRPLEGHGERVRRPGPPRPPFQSVGGARTGRGATCAAQSCAWLAGRSSTGLAARTERPGGRDGASSPGGKPADSGGRGAAARPGGLLPRRCWDVSGAPGTAPYLRFASRSQLLWCCEQHRPDPQKDSSPKAAYPAPLPAGGARPGDPELPRAAPGVERPHQGTSRRTRATKAARAARASGVRNLKEPRTRVGLVPRNSTWAKGGPPRRRSPDACTRSPPVPWVARDGGSAASADTLWGRMVRTQASQAGDRWSCPMEAGSPHRFVNSRTQTASLKRSGGEAGTQN